MSEYFLEDTANHVSSVIYDWLEAEVATSSDASDVNSVLDDYTKAVAGLRGGFDHPYNFAWNKFNAHAGRLAGWMRDLAEASPDDENFDLLAARVTFGGLMEISGSYRRQCYVEAKDAGDYLARRQGVIGTSITNATNRRLAARIPSAWGFGNARITLEELNQSLEDVTNYDEQAITTMVRRARTDLGHPGSRSAREMMMAQALWLDFTIDSIILAAKLKKGDLAGVPFREPRSDGEQSGKLWYPLREPLNWAEIMAANPPALKAGQ